MVKGITKQVILVKGGEPRLFEQAIFILRDDAMGREGVTDEALLKEANALLQTKRSGKGSRSGPLWALCGAGITGIFWALTMIF
jgi:hypothetical protein